jgi:hypothetical protein
VYTRLLGCHRAATVSLGCAALVQRPSRWRERLKAVALDAWHIAVAQLALPNLVEKDEEIGFASRDDTQAAVAEQLGFTRI